MELVIQPNAADDSWRTILRCHLGGFESNDDCGNGRVGLRRNNWHGNDLIDSLIHAVCLSHQIADLGLFWQGSEAQLSFLVRAEFSRIGAVRGNDDGAVVVEETVEGRVEG